MRPLRSVLAVLVATAGLGTLAACSSGSSGSAASAAATSGSATTRTVKTVEGDVVVPSSPQRIVAIQPYVISDLQDVGDASKVIGTYDEGAQYVSPRYLAVYNKAAKVGNDGQLDLEKIAALKPDLIIGTNYTWNTQDYKELSAIAPTVIAPVTSWQATAQTVADAVGRSAQIKALTTQLTTEETQIKTQYAAQLAKYKWDILQGGFDAGQYWIYGPGTDIGTVLAAAGVRFATASASVSGDNSDSVSYERIDELADADVIGYYSDYTSSTPTNDGPQLFAQGGFKALAATKAHRLVAIPDFLPGGYGDALGALAELRTGLKALASS